MAAKKKTAATKKPPGKKSPKASGVVKVDGKKELRKTAKIRNGQVVLIGDVRITVQGV